MKPGLTAFLSGFVFALGLSISGMTQPQKVIGFLNLFDSWDPSLLFVMIGAIGFHSIAYFLIKKRKAPLFSDHFHISKKTEITAPLVIGSLVFGFGWGLGGYCPGPAVTALTSFDIRPTIFLIFMIAGIYFGEKVLKKLQ